jgi:hypothetical protein
MQSSRRQLARNNMQETAIEVAPVDVVSEKRLWQAVLVTTIRDWMCGPLRSQRQAEEYLFEDKKDFHAVCKSAGMDPDQLRAKLKRLRTRVVIGPQSVENLASCLE